jgi:hypothetical protein
MMYTRLVFVLLLLPCLAYAAEPTPEETAALNQMRAAITLRQATDALNAAMATAAQKGAAVGDMTRLMADAKTALDAAATKVSAPAPIVVQPLLPPSPPTPVIPAPAPEMDPMWATLASTLLQVVGIIFGTVATALIGVYLPRAISAFETKTKVELSADQKATIIGAAMTAKGIIETKLDQGVMHLSQISTTNPEVVAQAQAAIARVPDTAAAAKKSVSSMAETIVGLIDTSVPRGAPLTLQPEIKHVPPSWAGAAIS